MTGAGGAKARKALSQRAILQLIGSSPILGQIGYLDAADSKTKSLGSRTLTGVRKHVDLQGLPARSSCCLSGTAERWF